MSQRIEIVLVDDEQLQLDYMQKLVQQAAASLAIQIEVHQYFTPANQFYGLIAVDGIEGIVLVTFLILTTIISIYVLKREKRIDVL